MGDGKQITFPFRTLAATPGRAAGDLSSTRRHRRRGPDSAPRRAALRVPTQAVQSELVFPSAFPHLFVHEGARQQLEKRLALILGDRLTLAVTDNRRTMISSSRKGGVLRLRLHHMFLDADPFTLTALGRYLRDGDRNASTLLGGFIESRRQHIAPPPRRPRLLRTAGAHHDLASLFELLNARYFQGLVDATVTWGRRAPPVRGRRRRQSIKLGTYCSEEKLVRIHPALDQPFVPRFFVEYIVFHEMLHHVMPMPVSNGRRQFHTPEFRARERTFAEYERAIRWEKRFVHRLLNS